MTPWLLALMLSQVVDGGAADAAVVTTPVPVVPAVPAGPRTYVIDGARSQVHVRVFKEGAAKALAHDHIVAAYDVQGSLTATANEAAGAQLTVTVSAASLVSDEPKLRTLYQLVTQLTDGERKSVNGSMKELLDVAKFPAIRFTSSGVTAKDGKWLVSGTFSLHGVERALTVPATVRFEGDRAYGEAFFDLKTSDYGMPPYAAFLGAVKNKDTVSIGVKLWATAR